MPSSIACLSLSLGGLKQWLATTILSSFAVFLSCNNKHVIYRTPYRPALFDDSVTNDVRNLTDRIDGQILDTFQMLAGKIKHNLALLLLKCFSCRITHMLRTVYEMDTE